VSARSGSRATAATILRWLARLLSSLVILFVVLEVLGDHSPRGPSRAEWIAIGFFPGALCLGFVVGWWREGLEALIATLGIVGFYVWSTASRGQIPHGPWFIVVWSPAVVFLASWLMHRRGDA